MKKLPLILLGFIFTLSAYCQTSHPEFPILADDVRQTLFYLSSDSLQGRDSGSEGIGEAAAYIENIFITAGVNPFFQTYKDTLANFDKPSFNIVGFIEGNDSVLKKEWVILGAHYDHIGIISPLNGDSIANGANDNAAGVTAVLSLAKHFAQSKSNKRSLMFVLFSAEEKGLLGSKHFAKRIKSSNLDIYTMLNFEMIGVPMKETPGKAYLTGFDLSNMAQKINEYAGEELVVKLAKAEEFNLFRRSDNLPFYEKLKIPAQTISTFDFTNYPYYHQVDDEAEWMDTTSMTVLINQMIVVIENMANSLKKEIRLHE